MNFKSLFSKAPKIAGFTIGTIIVIVALVFLIRSCSSNNKRSQSLYFIGRDVSWYPMQLAAKEKNLLAFTNDLLSIIASNEHLRFEFVDVTPTLLIQGLDNGHYDAIITTMRPNVVNQEKYDFSEMYYELGPVLILRKDSPRLSLKEMKGHTIGIVTGSSLIFNALRETGANIYELTFVSYDTNIRALDALVKKQIDAAIISALPAYSLVQSLYSNSLRIASAPLADEGVRLVGLKNERTENLIDKFDKRLEEATEDGTYKKLIEKWSLIDASHPPPQK